MSTAAWEDVVLEACQAESRENNGLIWRKRLVRFYLDWMKRETGTYGKTPAQTLSATLQLLTHQGVLKRIRHGLYRLVIPCETEGPQLDRAPLFTGPRFTCPALGEPGEDGCRATPHPVQDETLSIASTQLQPIAEWIVPSQPHPEPIVSSEPNHDEEAIVRLIQCYLALLIIYVAVILYGSCSSAH